MDYQTFEQLALKVKGCYFASSKRDAINKSMGAFTAQQVYRLQGQFTGGSDRVEIVANLHTSKRILPMTAQDAVPVIKMGIYSGQKRDLFKFLISYITDRDQVGAREVLGRNFTGADNTWVYREIELAGPYNGPPPVATLTGAGTAIITSNIVVPIGTHYTQNPISHAADNVGTALFGGIFTASMPNQRPGIATAVTYQGTVQPGTQVVYPQGTHYPVTTQPPVTPYQHQYPMPGQPPAPYQPNMYPPLPTHGLTDQPPAYSPADANYYPPTTLNQNATAPPSNIMYPPTDASGQSSQLPIKTPVA